MRLCLLWPFLLFCIGEFTESHHSLHVSDSQLFPKHCFHVVVFPMSLFLVQNMMCAEFVISDSTWQCIHSAPLLCCLWTVQVSLPLLSPLGPFCPWWHKQEICPICAFPLIAFALGLLLRRHLCAYLLLFNAWGGSLQLLFVDIFVIKSYL